MEPPGLDGVDSLEDAAELVVSKANACDTDVQARELAEKALDFDPNCVSARILLVQLSQGDIEERKHLAQEAVDAAVRAMGGEVPAAGADAFERCPPVQEYVRACNLMGQTLEVFERTEEAVPYYEEALRFLPDPYAPAARRLIACHLRLARTDEAERLLEEAESRSPECRRELIWALVLERFLSAGPEAARPFLREARQISPQIEAYLTGRRRTAREDETVPDHEQEEVFCAQDLLAAWSQHGPALRWLRAGGEVHEMRWPSRLIEEQLPRREDWQRLDAAAREFRKRKIWKVLARAELLGVQSSCCPKVDWFHPLGFSRPNSGAMLVHGTEGLDAGRSDELLGEHPVDAPFLSRGLVLLFLQGFELPPADREVIRATGQHVREDRVYPVFRRQVPGRVPTHPEREGVQVFARSLERLVQLVRNVRQRGELIEPGACGSFLVRTPHHEGGTVIWEDLWTRVVPREEVARSVPSLPAARIRSMQRSVRRGTRVWEVDLLFLPLPVGPDQRRSYFPRILACCDAKTGELVHQEVLRPGDNEELVECVLRSIEKTKELPCQVLVRHRVLHALFERLANVLLFNVLRIVRLPACERMRKDVLGPFDPLFTRR